MDLLKLPDEMREFLLALDGPKVIVGYADIGLCPTHGLKIVKWLAGIPAVKGSGTGGSVLNGTKRTRITSRPITCRER